MSVKFPIVGEKAAAPGLSIDSWRLRLTGLVDRPIDLTFAELLAMPQQEFVVDVHCVTGWSRPGTRFTGVRLRDVLERARVKPGAKCVRFVSHSPRAHDTSLPLDAALKDALIVHAADGRPLEPAHGFPVRSVMPGRYFYKSLKWLVGLELLAEDHLGYWERESAYHNVADPWEQQRFDESRCTPPERVEAIRAMTSFEALRDGPPVLLANFSNWKPLSRDFRGLQIRCSKFRLADLEGCDFRGGNFTLCSFRGANLRGADFTGADCEGADFTDADLSGVRMINTALSAAKFFTETGAGKRLGLRGWEGLVVQNPSGLTEEQEAYLRTLGVLRGRTSGPVGPK